MPDMFWIFVGFASVYVAFNAGAIYGLNKAWKDVDKIIDGYKKVADEAIILVNQYVKGGGVDGS